MEYEEYEYEHKLRVRAEEEVEGLHKQLVDVLIELSKVRKALADSIEQSESWEEVIAMIREFLINQGIDMSATPPMFYPEAILTLINQRIREDRETRGNKGHE